MGSRATTVTLAALAVLACATALAPPALAGTGDHGGRDGHHPSAPAVRLLGEQVVPNSLAFQGTTVGGLSGIDRDPRTGRYVLLSDDRSALQPARFYTARIDVTRTGVGPVGLTGVHTLLRPDAQPYPSLATWTARPCAEQPARCARLATVDPEDVRIDPRTGQVWWSQEGERIVPADGSSPTLIDPSVRAARPDGTFVRQLRLPANGRMTVEELGPRRNLALEGLTFAAGGRLVVSSLEAPLLQDGPPPTPASGALTRITVQDRAGAVLAQYAYPVEPVFAAPPAGGAGDNGVTAILADPDDSTRYLMVERGFVTGAGNAVRVFDVDIRGATNVARVGALAGAPHVRPVRKRLLVDLGTVGLSRVDNVEGVTWGPRLPTGERTLVFVSDDNFSAAQVTQVFALALRR